jgi:Family of unknown function (DUF6461)
MAATVEYYEELVEETGFQEGTVLIVGGAVVDEVADALGADRTGTIDPHDVATMDAPTHALYSFVQLSAGVLAAEDMGYADPPNSALVALSAGGRTAVVVRDNIQAHTRFACARDGVLLFDADEYVFIEDRSHVPADLRPLFDRAWVDLEADDDDAESAVAVGLAMAELVTGIELTVEDVERAASREATRYPVPTLRYSAEQG